jgi:DNA-binding IscR family transcriptional regulator
MTALKNLIEHPNDPTYISGIARETELSNSVVSKVITPLVMKGIVAEKPSIPFLMKKDDHAAQTDK